LFLTDIKREVENAQTELKQCKQEQNNAHREMALLKKENTQLQATLKRYRKQL
jgi:septation ring formation regulator EzrA